MFVSRLPLESTRLGFTLSLTKGTINRYFIDFIIKDNNKTMELEIQH